MHVLINIKSVDEHKQIPSKTGILMWGSEHKSLVFRG